MTAGVQTKEVQTKEQEDGRDLLSLEPWVQRRFSAYMIGWKQREHRYSLEEIEHAATIRWPDDEILVGMALEGACQVVADARAGRYILLDRLLWSTYRLVMSSSWRKHDDPDGDHWVVSGNGVWLSGQGFWISRLEDCCCAGWAWEKNEVEVIE